MRAEAFDQAVDNRANQELQALIKTFREKVIEALKVFPPDLLNAGDLSRIRDGSPLSDDGFVKHVLKQVTSTHPRFGWPMKLWEWKREEVATKLLEQLDFAQQCLLARGINSDIDDTFGDDDHETDKGISPDK